MVATLQKSKTGATQNFSSRFVNGHLQYVDSEFVVMNNPFEGGRLTLVKRSLGEPGGEALNTVLNKVHMQLDGDNYYNEKGKWCCYLKELNGDGARTKNKTRTGRS